MWKCGAHLAWARGAGGGLRLTVWTPAARDGRAAEKRCSPFFGARGPIARAAGERDGRHRWFFRLRLRLMAWHCSLGRSALSGAGLFFGARGYLCPGVGRAAGPPLAALSAERGACAATRRERGTRASLRERERRARGASAPGVERRGERGELSREHSSGRGCSDLADAGAVHGRAAWTGPEHPRAGTAARRAPERGRDEMRSARRVTRGCCAARDGAAARTTRRCRLFQWRAGGWRGGARRILSASRPRV
jgi:hypothetical protein